MYKIKFKSKTPRPKSDKLQVGIRKSTANSENNSIESSHETVKFHLDLLGVTSFDQIGDVYNYGYEEPHIKQLENKYFGFEKV
jgi:hypothetical protein